MIEYWTQQFKILNHNTSLQALNHLKKGRSLVSTDYNILSILTFPSNSHNDSTCISSFINHTLCLYIKIKPYTLSFYLNAGQPAVNKIKSLNTLGSNHII